MARPSNCGNLAPLPPVPPLPPLALRPAEVADTRSALEAEAYSAWMAGNVLLEKEADWARALALFTRARCVGVCVCVCVCVCVWEGGGIPASVCRGPPPARLVASGAPSFA